MTKDILIDSLLPTVSSTNVNHLLSSKKCLKFSIFGKPCSGSVAS